MQALRQSLTAAQLLALLVAAGFLVPATGNDIKDLTAKAHGSSVPSCAAWSILRPPCRR